MIKKFYYSIIKNKLKRPLYLIYFVTNKCNSKCIHCFNWKALNKKENELTLEEINKFTKEIGNLPSMGFSGGEPFLRNDLNEIIGLFQKNCNTKDFGIPTNCLMPKQIFDKTKKILENNPNITLTVYISLDGTKDTHDEIRGLKGAFEKVIETYELLKNLRSFKNFRLKITTTITNRNIHNIPELIFFVKKNMPYVHFQSFEIMRGLPPKSYVRPPTINQLKDLKRSIFDSYKGYSFYRGKKIQSLIAYQLKKFIFETYLNILEQKKQLVPCYVGTTHCILGSEGDISFCELTQPIGNIRENTFNEIWNSKKANILRNFIKNKKCYCVHSCFQQNNIVFTTSLYPKIFLYILKNSLKFHNKPIN